MRVHELPSNYSDYDKFLGNREERVIANNTKVYRFPTEGLGAGGIGVHYHATTIAILYPDGSVAVHTRGWHTSTTKQRLNSILGARATIHQKDHTWYVTDAEGTRLFEDGEVFARPDSLNPGRNEIASRAFRDSYDVVVGDKGKLMKRAR